MRVIKLEKSHIHFLESETLVDNPELLNLHNRLTIQSLIIVNYRPLSTIYQVYYFIVGGMFYKKVGIKLGGVSDWWRHLRKHLGTNESKTTLCTDGRGRCAPPPPLRAPASQPSRCTAPHL